jgi:hypothetical protein
MTMQVYDSSDDENTYKLFSIEELNDIIYDRLSKTLKNKILLKKAIKDSLKNKFYNESVWSENNYSSISCFFFTEVKKKYYDYVTYHKNLYAKLTIKKNITIYAVDRLYRYPNGLRILQLKNNFNELSNGICTVNKF